jgi:hypothetical protein
MASTGAYQDQIHALAGIAPRPRYSLDPTATGGVASWIGGEWQYWLTVLKLVPGPIKKCTGGLPTAPRSCGNRQGKNSPTEVERRLRLRRRPPCST